MPNHFFILGVVNISIFLTIIFKYFSKKLTKDWFIDLAPFLRISFVSIYGFAALAKLNTGFFSDKDSCAYFLANREFAWLGIDIDFTRFSYFPHLISATELIIFFSLLFRRTVPFAVTIACLFHTSLSLTPISQGLGFTFVLIGLLSLYFPQNSHVSVIRASKTWQSKLNEKIPLDAFKLVYSAISMAVAIAWLVVDKNRTVELAIRWLASLVILVSIALFLAFLSIKYSSERFERPIYGLKGANQFLIFFLVVVTGLSPYLGLKTRPTFTMFSNLKVEGNVTNHLFMPRLWPNNLADDLITIKSSSDPELANDAKNGVKWTYLELQRKLSTIPETAISFERNGKIFDYKKASEDSELVNPNWILTKFLSFRKVHPNDYCLW